jgi:hypothetical protein
VPVRRSSEKRSFTEGYHLIRRALMCVDVRQ